MAKILAVDDEPAILEMIESILNKDGHLVTKVSNPLKLNMEELHRYDLILLHIKNYFLFSSTSIFLSFGQQASFSFSSVNSD